MSRRAGGRWQKRTDTAPSLPVPRATTRYDTGSPTRATAGAWTATATLDGRVTTRPETDALLVVLVSGVSELATTTLWNAPARSIRALTRTTASAPTARVAGPQRTGRVLVHGEVARMVGVTPRIWATWLGWRGSTCGISAHDGPVRGQGAEVADPNGDRDHVAHLADARGDAFADRQVRAAGQRGREHEVGAG